MSRLRAECALTQIFGAFNSVRVATARIEASTSDPVATSTNSAVPTDNLQQLAEARDDLASLFRGNRGAQ
jgi:hypothetical protein